MNLRVLWICLLIPSLQLQAAEKEELRRAVPSDVYLVVHGMYNPERGFQRQYMQEVWKTVEETRIVEKVTKIISESVPANDLQAATDVMEEFREAAAPITLNALSEARQAIYCQRMSGISHQQLLILDLDAAADWELGIKNLMELVEKYSEGSVPVQRSSIAGAEVTKLGLPPEANFSPTVTRVDDLLLIANSEQLLSDALRQLNDPSSEHKFQDARLQQALKKLPEPEDTLVLYDGRTQFEQMRGIVGFIRTQAAGNEAAERVAGIVDAVLDEMAILDFEVTVEYTEGNQNRTQAYGRLLPGKEETLLYKAFAAGQPFEDWQAWVPADALSYSLQSGANLHVLYEGVMAFLNEHVPEAEPQLAKFEAIQAEIGIHLDRDILQSFSGESVSISLPPSQASMLGAPDSVMALRCQNPDRVRELLTAGLEALQQHPAAAVQQLRVIPSADIDGFEELTAVVTSAFGVRPTFGFVDGWMIIGSNPHAVSRVLAVRAGEADSVASSPTLEALNIDTAGPVSAVTYSNLGENIRNTAKMLGQAGGIAYMATGFAGLDAQSPEFKPVRDMIGLLPDVAKIIAKLDFFEQQLTVVQQLPEDPGAYLKRSVIQIRAVEEAESNDF